MFLNGVAVVVTGVWVANFAASLFIRDYDGSAINAIFPVVMGSILAIKARNSQKEDDGDEDG